MKWFTQIFEKFASLQLWAVILVAVLFVASVAALIVLIVKHKRGDAPRQKAKKGWDTKTMVMGALCISIAFILSYLQIIRMPQGGTITLASMLPIMIFAYIYGTPKGLVVGLAYGALQMLQDPYIVHWAQAILDYGLAFMALSVTGLFKKSILPGVALGGFLRYICHVISGLVFFASYAPKPDFTSVFIYSTGYNSFVLIETIGIFIIVLAVPQLRRFINAQKALAY